MRFSGFVLATLSLQACGGSAPDTRSGTFGEAAVLLTDQVIVAHRGASGHAPEHSFAAYDLALAMGAEYIEQDVLPTADGVLVVVHDDTLDRTARGPKENCSGRVSDKTLAQLKTCDIGSWFNETYPERADPAFVGLRMPTLDEVFARYGRSANYYIEIKPNVSTTQNVEQGLLDLIKAHGLYQGMVERHQVLVQSFIPSSLLTMHALDPAVPLIQLLPEGGGPLGLGAISYAIGIGPAWQDLDASLVEAAHELGLAVHPYTVNRVEDLERMLALCVDGAFTNFPDRYRTLLTTTTSGCPAPIR